MEAAKESEAHVVSAGGQIKLKDDIDEAEVSAILDRAKATKFKTLFNDLPEDVDLTSFHAMPDPGARPTTILIKTADSHVLHCLRVDICLIAL